MPDLHIDTIEVEGRTYSIHDLTKQLLEIQDPGGYFTADTVEGALQEIGATLDGLDAALAALL